MSLDHGLRFVRAAWMAEAACKGLDVDDFFVGKNEAPIVPLQVCPGCPVRRECLEYALVNELAHGWWGGVSPRRRARMEPGDTGPTPTWERISALREQGYSYRRIAAETQLCVSTVRTAVERMKQVLG